MTGILSLVPRPASADEVDFTKEIMPILGESCVSCHGANKQKGKLRLDTKEFAFKSDEVLVPGKPDESEFFHRITLPEDDDEVMPSKGDLLTKTQQDLIKTWIAQGAKWPDGLVIKTSGDEPKAAGPKVETIKPTSAELAAFAELEKLGHALLPIAMDSEWRYGNFRGLDADTAAKVLPLLKDMKTLIELNLTGARMTDAQLADLSGDTNLTRLNLVNTPITDAGLTHLKGLRNLAYLNLFNTAITDQGLQELTGLEKLRKLYLFQTKTTDAGITALKKALPMVEVVADWKTAEPAKTAPRPEEAKK